MLARKHPPPTIMKLRSGKDFSRGATTRRMTRKRLNPMEKNKDDSVRVAELERIIKMKNIYIEELNGEIDNLHFGLLLLLLFIFVVPLVIFVSSCT